MILSFHPMFVADRNRICAGRDPGPAELAQIADADAVVLPQGCRQSLFEMAVENCPHVFPDYTARFKYPGKIGQIKLFRAAGVDHPLTETFVDLAAFQRRYPAVPATMALGYPSVFKFDWGGEGETVLVIRNRTALRAALKKAAEYERSGQKGFLLQQYVPHSGRDLRVVVVDRQLQTYWRVQDDPHCILTNLRHGGRIDAAADPALQKKGAKAVRDFCRHAGINLAGLDVLFAGHKVDSEPIFLEINYFFGRRGLGGSEPYYRLLIAAIHNWLNRRGLSVKN